MFENLSEKLEKAFKVLKGQGSISEINVAQTMKEIRKALLAADVDFVTIGRGAILHHDYPRQVMNNDAFEPIALPVSRAHLAQEGLSETFIEYMNGWKGFVADG